MIIQVQPNGHGVIVDSYSFSLSEMIPPAADKSRMADVNKANLT